MGLVLALYWALGPLRRWLAPAMLASGIVLGIVLFVIAA